ncbi:MAG: hypothetical protein ACAI43_23270 [Phycisphaerae bacterium]|nr:hypothetical protein [Tepidisphaeraceae bacterium]
MGVDWLRVRFPAHLDRASLDALIAAQALCYQTCDGWNTPARDPVRDALTLHAHGAAEADADHMLHALARFPHPPGEPSWGRPNEYADDHPHLSAAMRVYPITRNPTFPPLWRLAAHRTFLPDQVAPQVDRWRAWATDAAAGRHDAYLRQLQAYENATAAHERWPEVRRIAAESDRGDGAWRHTPERRALRETMMRFPSPPPIPDVPIEPGPLRATHAADLVRQSTEILDYARRLVDLVGAWDAGLKSGHRIGYDAAHYALDFDAFRARAADPWLDKCFDWATAAAANGYALLLDH